MRPPCLITCTCRFLLSRDFLSEAHFPGDNEVPGGWAAASARDGVTGDTPCPLPCPLLCLRQPLYSQKKPPRPRGLRPSRRGAHTCTGAWECVRVCARMHRCGVAACPGVAHTCLPVIFQQQDTSDPMNCQDDSCSRGSTETVSADGAAGARAGVPTCKHDSLRPRTAACS